MHSQVFVALLMASLIRLGSVVLLELVKKYRVVLLTLCLVGCSGIALLASAFQPMIVTNENPVGYAEPHSYETTTKDAMKLIESWEIIRQTQPNNPQLQQNPVFTN
jgi:hypothetical protein